MADSVTTHCTRYGKDNDNPSAFITLFSRSAAEMIQTHTTEQLVKDGYGPLTVSELYQFVATMLILGVVIAGVIGTTGTTAQADQAVAGQSIEPRTVIAQPGDTLWAIAKRVAPQANISDLVDQLVRINGDAIVAGQLVRIP